MGLSLVVGPAHAGKVALLLDRFVDEIDRDPWLIVPNRAEVDRAERELVSRCNGLLAGTVGTFDSLFEALAAGNGGARRLLGETERHILLRRVVERHGHAERSSPGVRGRVRTHPRRGRRRARRAATISPNRSRVSSAGTGTSSSASAHGIAALSAGMRSGA